MKVIASTVCAVLVSYSVLARAEGERPPLRPLSTPAPQYPEEEQKAGHSGRALVRLKVLQDGTVGSAEISKSTGFAALDNAALEAVKKWTFAPPTGSGGDPTEVTAQVPIDFSSGDGKSSMPLNKEEMEAFWKKPCSQIASEASAFKASNPEGKLGDMKTFKATAGLMFLGSYGSTPEKTLKIFRALPAAYELVVTKCRDSPEATYGSVFKESLDEVREQR